MPLHNARGCSVKEEKAENIGKFMEAQYGKGWKDLFDAMADYHRYMRSAPEIKKITPQERIARLQVIKMLRGEDNKGELDLLINENRLDIADNAEHKADRAEEQAKLLKDKPEGVKAGQDAMQAREDAVQARRHAQDAFKGFMRMVGDASIAQDIRDAAAKWAVNIHLRGLGAQENALHNEFE